MYTLGACLIEEQLYKVRAASLCPLSFNTFIHVLHNILQSLTKFSSDDASLTIKKDTRFFKESLSLPEIQELLKLLGYQEEEDRYVFQISDENCMKSDGCLYLLEEMSKKNNSASLPIISEHQDRENSPFGGRQSKSLNDLEDRSRLPIKENCEGAIKASFLMRHLKKEENSNILFSHLRHNTDQKRRSSSYTFNGNGYFHQSCNRKDSDSRRNPHQKFFQHHYHHNHVQDSDAKKWGRTGLGPN